MANRSTCVTICGTRDRAGGFLPVHRSSHLIRHGNEDRQEEHVDLEVVNASKIVFVPVGEFVGHVDEIRHGDGEVVAVRFDEIVPGDRGRIDVMFTKWTQKVSTDKWHVHRSPGIS